MNWRYFDPRAGDYRVMYALEGEKLIGYSVLRVNRFVAGYPIGYVVDLLALPGRLDVVDSLLADAEQYFSMEDVNIVLSALFSNHPYKPVFNKHGFLDSRVNLTLFYNYNDEKRRDEILAKTEEAKRVHFMYGDIDSLPVNMNPHG